MQIFFPFFLMRVLVHLVDYLARDSPKTRIYKKLQVVWFYRLKKYAYF